MLLFREPSSAAVRDFLAGQSRLELSYPAVGATASLPPAGYVVDHNRVKLGRGEDVFRRARAALEGWKQFDLGWVRACPADTPLRAGEVVAVVARVLGVW